MLNAGDPFPKFELLDQDNNIVKLDDLLGSKSIIYFYPKDDTSGCTAEACEFNELMPKFEGAKVVGVSPDSASSHKKFANKYSLTFTLLADTDQILSNAVGVWKEKSMYGKKYMGVERTTFLLDENGAIIRVWDKVKPKDHAAEVLASI
jgi:peroxiredoxin Q/BCP